MCAVWCRWGEGCDVKEEKRKAVEARLGDVEVMFKRINLVAGLFDLPCDSVLLKLAFDPDPNPISNAGKKGKGSGGEEDAHLAKAVKNDNSAA